MFLLLIYIMQMLCIVISADASCWNSKGFRLSSSSSSEGILIKIPPTALAMTFATEPSGKIRIYSLFNITMNSAGGALSGAEVVPLFKEQFFFSDPLASCSPYFQYMIKVTRCGSSNFLMSFIWSSDIVAKLSLFNLRMDDCCNQSLLVDMDSLELSAWNVKLSQPLSARYWMFHNARFLWWSVVPCFLISFLLELFSSMGFI